MRIFLIIALCLLIVSPTWTQGQLFPVAKNGKWGLVDSSGKFILAHKYDYIEYIFEADKYVYDLEGLKGIINADGSVFSKPVYQDMILYDTLWVSAKHDGKWNLTKGNDLRFNHQFDSVVMSAPNTFLLYTRDQAKLYQGNFSKTFKNEYTGVFKFNNNIAFAKHKNEKYDIINQLTGELLAENTDSLRKVGYNYGKIERENKRQLIDLKKEKLIGQEMDQIIYQFGNLFYCTNAGNYFLFSANENVYYAICRMDEVTEYDYPIVQFRQAGKVGIWNLATEKMVISPAYESIEKVDGIFLTSNFGRYGIITQSGREILSTDYESINIHAQFFHVTKFGRQGIVSKNGSTVVPIIHETIKVYDKNIKCYTADAITIVKLDESGAYKSQKTFDNYMTISIEKERLPRKKSSDVSFGGSGKPKNDLSYYAQFGWFKPINTRMVKDSLIEYRGKWGLKDTADSVIIRPQYAELIISTDYKLTLAFAKSRYSVTKASSKAAINHGWGIKLTDHSSATYQAPFHLIGLETYKYLRKKHFFSVFLNDFDDYRLARGFDGQPILLDQDGNTYWKNLRFYGNYSEDILRICSEGRYALKPSKTGNTICATKTFLLGTGAIETSVSSTEEHLEITDGEWFYISKLGQQLNEEPFDLAKEFKHSLAIVKKNGKWGVVDTSMQVIIPIEYEKIERVIVGNESFFKVNNRVNENYLYNKDNGGLSKTDITKLDYFHEGRWFAKKRGNAKWGLLDTNLRAITKFEFDQVFPFVNGYATVVIRGKRSLINNDGHTVLPFYKCKKIEALGFDRYAIKGKRGKMVININGDTLLQETECKKILSVTADYLVYEKRGHEINLLNFKNGVNQPKNSRILSYSLKDNVLLVQKKGKKRLFSLETGKFLSKALVNIVSLGEGSMIYRGKNGLLGYLSLEGDTLCPPKFKILEAIRNGWAFSKQGKTKGLVDKTGEYLPDSQRIYRVKKLGENFTVMAPKGIGLMDPYGQVLIPAAYLKIEVYNSQFYKATKMNRVVDIYTQSGEKINDKSFENIKAISSSSLIVTHEGFDYLYNGGLNKSLSFQHIDPVSSNLYLLNENRHYGMFNNQGEVIIPIQYHKIDVVHNYFQVGFFNSFGYFGLRGQELADPHYLN